MLTGCVAGFLPVVDVFLDIGACFGYHSIVNAIRVGQSGRVYSFEPQPEAFSQLQDNILLNCLTNVVAERIALSDKSETLTLYRFQDLDIGHTSISPLNRNDYQIIQTPAQSLDSYLAEKNVCRIVLAKLDVEGAELRVLKGASHLLASSTPPMWILELNYETAISCGYHPRESLSLLRSFGYSFYQPLWRGVLVPQISTLTEVENLDSVRHGQNILCAIDSIHKPRLARVGIT